ncbi:MAG: lysophospholipid acyltransferase family protein [Candidatus Omnitrophica bacterium]|nr:lysophospholipid acyltransferase family protein [Candidatus Omnitrophota bacterium]MCF7893601.1 lysophospholipid acyltransferase family protein [Candidatus Omnitrophota bacterium]
MYYLFILGKIIALAGPRAVSYRIAKFFALLHCCFSKKDREAVLYNLGPLVRQRQRKKKVAKKVFINFAYYLTDFFRYSRLTKKFIKKYVSFGGLDLVDKIVKEKRGAILLTAHLGNYELGGAVMSLLGYPLSVVALPHLDLRTNIFFNRQRKRVGIDVIPTGVAIKKTIKALNQGRLLALLGDRDFSHSGRRQKVFSRFAEIPRGVAFFAKKTAAAVVPTFFVRENKYHYRLIFENEIEYDRENENVEEDILQKYVAVLEKYLKKYPDQWYLFQKYWQ